MSIYNHTGSLLSKGFFSSKDTGSHSKVSLPLPQKQVSIEPDTPAVVMMNSSDLEPIRKQSNPNGSFMNLVLWTGASTLLGWRANVMWHDTVSPDCLIQRTPAPTFPLIVQHGNSTITYATIDELPTCWQFGDFHYQMVGIAAATFLALVVGKFLHRAFKMPCKSCTMNFCKSEFTTEKMLVRNKKPIEGRWLQEIVHVCYCLTVFFFWNYIERNDTDSTNDRTYHWLLELPVWRLYFQGFAVIVPTICAEIMAIQENSHSVVSWTKYNMPWALASILCKALLFGANDFVLSPDTQRIWEHSDDSVSQHNLVVALSLFLILVVIYFWNKFGKSMQKNPGAACFGWPCVDFPIFMFICAQIGYNLSARLDDQSLSPAITYDFLSQILYGYFVFLGIFNICVQRTSDDYNTLEKEDNANHSFNIEVNGSKNHVPRI